MRQEGDENVRKAFQIFKRDVSRLLHNPVATVITLGICIIPSLYAWYNIEANWDPYGNTSGVKIAVANEDRGVESELVGSLNAGDQIVGKLEENDDLGWVFTEADEAKAGVYSGDYYAAIIVPNDFSERLISMFEGDFRQPELKYYVNEKKNAIAPKVTDTGAETIEEQLNETFVAMVSETLLEKAQKLGVDVSVAGERGERGILASIESSIATLERARNGMRDMGATIDVAKTAAGDARDSLAAMDDERPSLVEALESGGRLLGTTRAAARDLHTSLSSALSDGALRLGAVSAKADAAVGSMAGAVSAAKTKIDASLVDFQQVVDLNERALGALREVNDAGLDSAGIAALIDELEGRNAELQAVKDGLQAQSDALGGDADSAAGAADAINAAVQGSVDGLNETQKKLDSQVMPVLSEGLDAFSDVSGDLNGIVMGLEPTIRQSMGQLDQLAAMLDQTKGALESGDRALGDLQGALETVKTDVVALRSSAAAHELSSLLDMDPKDIAGFMSAPVALTTKAVYPVENYGSGVAPFYTNLALWVGGFVLIAVLKLEVDTEGVGDITANEGYFGRWALMVLLGSIQAVVACVGDLALGIQCEHPVLFVIAGLFASFVYVNIIYSLAIAFKHIGKAIGVLLVIVQIPGSSGMYPIEMMPGFFRALHPLLPFTYGINAMRETIGGMYGVSYLRNLGALAVFLAAALAVGVLLRPRLLNLNVLFDRRLSTTRVMICERDGMGRERLSVRHAIRALLDAGAFRREILERGAKFERRYPLLMKTGFCMVFGFPLLLFALTAMLDLDIDGKLVMLLLWIAATIVADVYMIVVEYLRESLNSQVLIASLAEDELREELGRAIAGDGGVGGDE